MRVERLRVGHPEGGPQKTKLSEQDSTDVNLIMASWIDAGAAVGSHQNAKEGVYGDFSSGLDYHTAMSAVKEADALFMELPSKVRNHVENDPGKLLDLVRDPERRDELEELGLVPSEKPGGDLGGPLSEVLKELMEIAAKDVSEKEDPPGDKVPEGESGG